MSRNSRKHCPHSSTKYIWFEGIISSRLEIKWFKDDRRRSRSDWISFWAANPSSLVLMHIVASTSVKTWYTASKCKYSARQSLIPNRRWLIYIKLWELHLRGWKIILLFNFLKSRTSISAHVCRHNFCALRNSKMQLSPQIGWALSDRNYGRFSSAFLHNKDAIIEIGFVL